MKGFAEEIKALADQRRCSNRRRVELRSSSGSETSTPRRSSTSPSWRRSGPRQPCSSRHPSLKFRQLLWGMFSPLQLWSMGARTRDHVCICGNHVVRGSVFVFQSLHPETGAPLRVKCVIAAMCIFSSASEMSLGVTEFSGGVQFAWKLEYTVLPVIALSFHSSAAEDVDHEALWLASVIKVQFWINRVASKIVFQPLVPYTGAPLHEERVIAVRQESNVHFEFYLRNVTGVRTGNCVSHRVYRMWSGSVEARVHNAPSLCWVHSLSRRTSAMRRCG